MPFFDMPDGPRQAAVDRTFLAGATAADWQTMLRAVGAEPFAAGQTLIAAGDPGDSFFILAEGTVEVRLPKKFGVKVVATIHAGSVFGEIAFLDGDVRTANVRALTAGTMLRVSREAFASIEAWDPKLAQRIALDLGRLCAVRLRQTLGKAGR